MLVEVESISVNFSIQLLIYAGLGVRAGFESVLEVCVLHAEVCCGQKGFGGTVLKRIFR